MKSTLKLVLMVFLLLASNMVLAQAELGCHSASVENKNIFRCLDHFSYQGSSGIHGYDLYLPGDYFSNNNYSVKYPVLVVIHGGGWGGSRADSGSVGMAELGASLGFVVANIDYYSIGVSSSTLDESQKWTNSKSAPNDVAAFMDRVVFNPAVVSAFKLNTSRVLLTGISAGGHLALLEATRGSKNYYGVLTSSAPTRIDDMTNYNATLDPRFKYTLDNVFGSNDMSFRAAMSPYNRRHNLRTKYLFMEHSLTDTIVPFLHAAQFVQDTNISGLEKEYFINPGSGSEPGSHNVLGDYLAASKLRMLGDRIKSETTSSSGSGSLTSRCKKRNHLGRCIR